LKSTKKASIRESKREEKKTGRVSDIKDQEYTNTSTITMKLLLIASHLYDPSPKSRTTTKEGYVPFPSEPLATCLAPGLEPTTSHNAPVVCPQPSETIPGLKSSVKKIEKAGIPNVN
jgi:hypothetical protein